MLCLQDVSPGVNDGVMNPPHPLQRRPDSSSSASSATDWEGEPLLSFIVQNLNLKGSSYNTNLSSYIYSSLHANAGFGVLVALCSSLLWGPYSGGLGGN